MTSENAQHYQFSTDPTTGEQMISLKPEYNPYAQHVPPPPLLQHQPSLPSNNTAIPLPHHNIPPPPSKQPSNINIIPPPPPLGKQQTIIRNIPPPPPPKEKTSEKATEERRGVKRPSHEDYMHKYGGNLSKEFPPNDSVNSSVMAIRSKLKKTNRIVLPPSVMAQLNEQPEASNQPNEQSNKKRKIGNK